MGILTNILSFLISFGLVVAVHELGHLIAAKILGIGVKRFSIGIGKRLFGIRRGETDYCLSMIPIGGYVRLAGDVNENPLAAEPSHLNANPPWKRIIVYLSGPVANILLALILNFVVNISGYDEFRIAPVIGGIVEETPDGKPSPASQAGLREGDVVVAVDGNPIEDWSELSRQIILHTGEYLTLTIEREGEKREFDIAPWIDPESGFGQVGIMAHLEPVVSILTPLGEDLGFSVGDRILTINGASIGDASDFEENIEYMRALEKPPETVAVSFQRGEKHFALDIPFKHLDTEPVFTLGGSVRHVDLGFFTAIGRSVSETFTVAYEFYGVLYLLLAQRIPASEAIGGPLSIAAVSGRMAEAGFGIFVRFVAFLAIMLGIMNTLPIPMLDGGLIVLLVVEIIRGHPLSLKVRQRIQYVGMAILGFLLIFALYSDIKRLFF